MGCVSIYRYLCPLHGAESNGQLMTFWGQSYWDDSSSNHFCCMAGYTLRVADWERFDSEWKKVLDTFHITRAHMTDFVAHAE
jgi:hypothetical protein